MKREYPEKSLMWHLKKVKDPRRREGLVYPLWGLLGMLILAGINGQKTLRSMWLWGAIRWERISRPLGFSGQAQPPSYGTIWYVLKNLEVGRLEEETREWASQLNQAESEGWSVDGKVLRGSRREDPHQTAVQVVTMVAQTLKRVMGQQIAAGGDQSEATIRLLKAVPLEGKLVTLDAGLLHRETANTIVEGGGNYLGPLKGNQAEVKKAVDEWIDAKIFPLGRSDGE
ncbi:MAG: ISAs1 family transposase [Anaerolineaceae bacterium]|nr:ISAs1 family transposase [Anaerolineaceae bacterium]